MHEKYNNQCNILAHLKQFTKLIKLSSTNKPWPKESNKLNNDKRQGQGQVHALWNNGY